VFISGFRLFGISGISRVSLDHSVPFMVKPGGRGRTSPEIQDFFAGGLGGRVPLDVRSIRSLWRRPPGVPSIPYSWLP